MTTERTQAKQDLAAAQAELQRLQAEKKSAETELAKANQNLAATQHALNEKTAESSRLQQEINNLTSSSSAQTQELNKKLTQLQEELKNTKEHLKTQEDLVAQSNARIQSLETQLNTSNQNLAEKTTALSEANTHEQNLQNQINRLTNNLSEKEREVTTTKARATTAEENARNLQNELNRKKSEIDTLTQQKNDLSEQLTQATQNHQLEKTRLENEVQAANEKAKQAELLANTANQEKEQALAEKNAAVKRAETAEAELVKLQQTDKPNSPNISNSPVDNNIPPISKKVGSNKIIADGKTRDVKSNITTEYKNQSYITTYSYNLEHAGYYIQHSNNRGIEHSIGGNLTNAKQLETLSGRAAYIGQVATIVDITNRTLEPQAQTNKWIGKLNSIKLNVDFSDKTISGVIYHDSMIQPVKDISFSSARYDTRNNDLNRLLLSSTEIKVVNDAIAFSGNMYADTTGHPEPSYKMGTYNGNFMGPSAEQISGGFYIDRRATARETIEIHGAFAAEKQK